MENKVELSLYLKRMNGKNNRLLARLIKFCDEQFGENYKLNLYDVSREPESAVKENIMVLPTLVREFPKPKIRVTSDFADIRKIMLILKLIPV